MLRVLVLYTIFIIKVTANDQILYLRHTDSDLRIEAFDGTSFHENESTTDDELFSRELLENDYPTVYPTSSFSPSNLKSSITPSTYPILEVNSNFSDSELSFTDTPTGLPTIAPSEEHSQAPTLKFKIIQDDDYVYNPVEKSVPYYHNIFNTLDESEVIVGICLSSFLLALPFGWFLKKYYFSEGNGYGPEKSLTTKVPLNDAFSSHSDDTMIRALRHDDSSNDSIER